MEIDDLKKYKLQKLVELARSKGDHILAVNPSFDAYCPSDGIIYPNYYKSFSRLYNVLREEHVSLAHCLQYITTVIGTKLSWAETYSNATNLIKASYFQFWISRQNKHITNEKAGVGDGNCGNHTIWYFDLPLSKDVSIDISPFEVEALNWRSVLEDCKKEAFDFFAFEPLSTFDQAYND